jgi:UDP-N-acetylglucosamine acyltransferase
MSLIDPRAVVADGASIDDGVEIGPFAVIGENVKIGKKTVIAPHTVIEGHVTIGAENKIGPFAYIGGPPQHVAYKGEETSVVIGDRNTIREYVTVHAGTADGNKVTKVGNDNFIMLGSHIAHDCDVGNRIIMANHATLAGHVIMEDDVVFGGFVAIHQHCKVGKAVMVAAGTILTKDPTPYSLVGGDTPHFIGLNRVGLKRIGMDRDTKKAVRKAYRLIFAKSASLSEGLDEAEKEYKNVSEVSHIVEFIRSSKRGIIRA